MTLIYEKMTAETWDYKKNSPVYPSKGAFEVSYDLLKYFVVDGNLHRTDGPAWIGPDGSQEYLQNGKYHRTDGPACIYPNGDQRYYQFGELHRADGPAVILADGFGHYYLFGQKYSKEEWEPLALQLKLKEQIV